MQDLTWLDKSVAISDELSSKPSCLNHPRDSLASVASEVSFDPSTAARSDEDDDF